MNISQPSLWDNVALENAYRCLLALELDEALVQFRLALQNPIGDQESIQTAIETCVYWKKWVQFFSEPSKSKKTAVGDQDISDFLKDYLAYPFPSKMTGFKKALLGCLSEVFQHNSGSDEIMFETIFDVLLNLEMYQKMENLALHVVKQSQKFESKNYWLLYFLAQAQWLNDNKTEAHANYARAFLHCPDESFLKRIENHNLKKLIQSFGIAMVPAYGWIYDILPFIHDPDIKPLGKEHQHAIQNYQLLWKAHKVHYNNENKDSTSFRKKLMELDLNLFKISLKQKKI